MPRLSIRRKLAAALAVPLSVLMVFTVLEVAKAASDAAEVGEQTELAKSAIGPAGIITALQNERSWLAVALVGQEEAVTVPVVGFEETRAQTDAAIEAFRAEVARHSDVVGDAYGPALDGLEALDQVRADVDAEPGPRDLSNIEYANGVFDSYSNLIEPFFDGTSRVALVIDDPELRQGAELADVVGRQLETLALLITATINSATDAGGGINEPDEVVTIAMLQADFRDYAAILEEPTGPYAALARERFPAALNTRINGHVDNALETGQVDLLAFLADVDVPEDEGYHGYMTALHSLITERADRVRSDAERRQAWFAALAALALVGAVALTLLVSRSITRPLRSLTGQAKAMAERRLPDAVLDVLETPLGDDVRVPHIEPVAIRTRDEVADVAAALNTVQESALDLAVEQAVLRRNIADSFVHLGRRNQNLLGRQLDFITELEADEADSDALASLFRLDHLATRMRRNAESLLVLAGVEAPRKWAAPVRLNDVVRAALGEVEDYHRVALTGIEPATVVGSLAADLAHLVAELLENALRFSPPDRSVEVHGRHDPGGGYELAIVDRGTGMPPAELEQANRRLAGIESFTVAPSKYLGHYVAGNLAARHGIAVRLEPTPGHGVTTRVRFPQGLLVADDTGRDAHAAAPPHRRPGPARPAAAPPEPDRPAVLPPGAGGAGAGQPRDDRPASSPAWAFLQATALTGGPAPFAPGPRTGPGAAPQPPRQRGPWPAREPAVTHTAEHHLARRVPGRQLPTSAPVPLRRGGPGAGAATAGAAAAGRARAPSPCPNPPPRAGPGTAHAHDVYGFLAQFTAGVQRGLDEARQSDRPPPGHG